MDAEVGVLDELGFAPIAGLSVVVGFYMAVDCITCKPRVNANTKCSHMPSRTWKPMFSQSAELSATTMKSRTVVQYQGCQEVEEEKALRRCSGETVYILSDSRFLIIEDKRKEERWKDFPESVFDVRQ